MPPLGRKMYHAMGPLFFVLGALFPAAGMAAAADAKDAKGANDTKPAVYSVRIGDYAAKTRIVLDLSGKISFSIFSLADPYRMVINLPEVDWRLKDDDIRPGKRITGFRFGLFRPGQSRMVIDVARPVRVAKSFYLEPGRKRGHRLVIDLADTSRASFLADMRRSQVARLSSREPSPGRTPAKPAPPRDSRHLIAIDPGHGGVDPGARGRSGSWEKNLTLAQAMELKRQLLAS